MNEPPFDASLSEEVLQLTSGISAKFVPTPDRKSITGDLLLGLKRFKSVVRWRWFFMEQRRLSSENKTCRSSKLSIAPLINHSGSASISTKQSTTTAVYAPSFYGIREMEEALMAEESATGSLSSLSSQSSAKALVLRAE